MKKILLATTILAASAGIAAAADMDNMMGGHGVTLDGKGAAGVRKIEGADLTVYNYMKVSFGGSVETDSGLTLGVSSSISYGANVDLDDVTDDDATSGALDNAKVTIDGSFGSVAIKDEGLDHLYDDGDDGDISYSNSFGDVSVDLVLDVDHDDTADAADLSGQYSAKAGYKAGDIAASVAIDGGSRNKLEASYTMAPATVTVTSDTTADTDADRENTLKVAFAQSGFDASLEYAMTAKDITVGLGYKSEGAYALNAEYVMPDAGDSTWKLYGSYDLGGADVVAGVNSIESLYAGVNFAF